MFAAPFNPSLSFTGIVPVSVLSLTIGCVDIDLVLPEFGCMSGLLVIGRWDLLLALSGCLRSRLVVVPEVDALAVVGGRSSRSFLLLTQSCLVGFT